jgi:hypothetical protein
MPFLLVLDDCMRSKGGGCVSMFSHSFGWVQLSLMVCGFALIVEQPSIRYHAYCYQLGDIYVLLPTYYVKWCFIT